MWITRVSIALALWLAAPSAHAQGAWAAARGVLPADTKLVVGVDLVAAQRSPLFATLYPKLREQADVARGLEALKKTCDLDPLKVLRGVVVATAATQDEGAVFLSVAPADRPKVDACLDAIARADGAPGKTVVGNIVQFGGSGEPAFAAWLGKDVLVVALHARDRAALDHWTGGKGALRRTSLGKQLGKLATGAAVWGAREGDSEVQAGVNARGGYGTLTVSGGASVADVHLRLASAAQATELADAAQGKLAAMRAAPGPLAKLGALVRTVTVEAVADEVVVKGSFADADVLAALPFVGVASP